MSGERRVITDLHIMVNFMEKSPQEEQSQGKDGYWAVVQAMQQHEQFLEGMLLRNIETHCNFTYISLIKVTDTKPGYSFALLGYQCHFVTVLCHSVAYLPQLLPIK